MKTIMSTNKRDPLHIPYSINGDLINLQLTAHQFECIVKNYDYQSSDSSEFEEELENTLYHLCRSIEREMGEDYFKTPYY